MPTVEGTPRTIERDPHRYLELAKRHQWNALDTAVVQMRKACVWNSDFDIVDEETGMTIFLYACKDGKRGVFEALLDFGYNIKERAKDGMTPLHLAVCSNAEIIVQQLLKHGADAMAVGGPESQLALHLACLRPSCALILTKLLLARMPNDGRLILDGKGQLPICYALNACNDVLVEELLSEFPTQQAVEWRERKTKNSLLHLSVMKRDVKTSKVLIEIGKADVNAINSIGQTPLHIAAANSDEKMVRLFCQYHPNPDILDKSENAPLHFAIRNGHTIIAKLIADEMHGDVQVRTNDGSTLMHIAAEFGHVGCVLALCQRNVPLHMPNKTGVLSLHLASKNGHVEVARTLLQFGAPINAKTKDRYTSMHLAVLHKKPDVIQLLMGLGASVGGQGGPAGEMPLHIAARINSIECAKMLLLTGAKLNATTGQELESALHIATRRGYEGLTELLLNDGADVFAVSRLGETALHLAVRHCHYNITRLLLSYVKHKLSKKDSTKLVNLQSAEGETTLHFACGLSDRCQHYPLEDIDILRLLMKYGADPTISTRHTGESALHYCARVGNLSIAMELAKIMDMNFPPLGNRQAKARVDIFDENGLSALHLASANGFLKCSNILLQKKAFVNIKTRSGITPIHLASANGYDQLIRLLVEQYGAATDVTTIDKKTPLHLAAENGHKDAAHTLVLLKANVIAIDAFGQTPLHLAAENDHSEVVKMFLHYKPELVFTANQDGMTCAHIAAAKGSVAVIKELMHFNKNVVITARNKTTDSLPLHLAAEGGHGEVVRILLAAGSSPLSENIDGMTCIHLAAKEGHSTVLAAIPQNVSWAVPSSKTGLTPLHVAVFFSKIEMVREMLARVPPDIPSQKPLAPNIRNEKLKSLIMIDYGLTPLHVASFAGVDQAVRLLLNLPSVDIEARSAVAGTTAIHLAAQTGSLNVSSLLLSQSSALLRLQDTRGLKPLHMAARNGHCDMAASLISQGSDINISDNHGWVPLHHATRCGQLGVVKLLLELGANVMHATRDDRVPLSLSAASHHVDVFMYLLGKEHDTDALLEDKKFILDLMKCGRANQQKAIEEFVLVSESPLRTAARLSWLFMKRSEIDLENAKDFDAAGKYCEKLTGSLMEICSAMTSPSRILRATDPHGKPFIDMLVDFQLKTVVAEASVQRYLTEVWEGNLGKASGASLMILFVVFIFFPPALFYCSLPFGQKYHRLPIIKFMAYAASHIQFIIVLCSVCVVPFYPISTRQSFLPSWNEYVLLLYLGGNLTAELTNPSNGEGGRIVKVMTLGLSAIAAALQLAAIFYPLESPEASMLMYFRNLVLSLPVMISVLSIIEILTFSKMFGPLTIILQYMIQEASVAMTIMMVFFVGWWLQDQTIFTPICPDLEPILTNECVCNIRVPKGCDLPYTLNNVDSIVPGCWSNTDVLEGGITMQFLLGIMHGALFQHEDFLWHPAIRNSPEWTISFTTIHKAMFHIVMVLIILMLVVSISADTLERLMAKSDLEWQFERAKLIRNMSKTASTPAPLNLFVKPIVYLRAFINRKSLLCTSYAPYYIMLEEGVGDSADLTEEAEEGSKLTQRLMKFLKRHLLRNQVTELMKAAAKLHQTMLFGKKPKKVDRKVAKAHKVAAKKAATLKKRNELQMAESLLEVISWDNVVDRFREAEAEESEDEYIEQLGCFHSELEEWQADMWDEADDIEDDEERIYLREWLVEEFKDVVKTS